MVRAVHDEPLVAHAGAPCGKGGSSHMSRRNLARAMRTLVLLVAFAIPTVALSSPAQAAPDPNQPTLIWGAFARPVSGQSSQQAVQSLETKVGRQLGAVRVFLLWDEAFPTSYHTWLRDTGRLPLISVKALRTNGQLVLWRDIVNAPAGSALHNQIVSWADKIKAFGVPVYFTFNHEPEAAASSNNGTDAEFIGAWRKVISIFRDRAVTNAKFLWIMTEYSFERPASDRRQAVKWFPGDAYVDALGADAYNDYTCRTESDSPWKTLAQDIEAFRLFGLNHPGKEMWLPEWASFEDPNNATRKAAWIDQVRALFKTDPYSQFKGILYFHSYRPGTPCLWWVDSSAASLNAFTAMGADVFYTRRIGDPPPPPPPGNSQALLVVGDPALGAGDTAIQQRLVAAGYAVTVADDSAVTVADTTNRSVVLVSATVNSSALGSRLRDITRPVVIWKASLYDDMRMTASNAWGITRSSTINIVNPSSPLVAGRSGTVTVITTNDYQPWGTAGPAAHVAATVGGQPTLFSYAAGAALPGGGVATGCRVAVPAYQNSPANFTADGRAIFDAAVAWADSCS
jgi:hypothetical protein